MKRNPLAQEDAVSGYKFDELLYVGSGSASRVLRALSISASDTISINLSQDNSEAFQDFSNGQTQHLPQVLRGRDL